MRTRLVLLMAAMAIIASGCFKVNFTIDVNEDGSGTLEGLTAVNFETVGTLFGDLGEDAGDLAGADQICNDFAGESGIDTSEFSSATPYRDGDFCGVEFSETFAPGQFTTAASALGDGGGDAILRQESDGGWYFEAPFDADSLGGGDVPPGFDDIFDGAEYIFRVRLPGRQVDHNGEIDPEGYVIWDVDITNPPERLFLRTEPGERITGNASAGGDDGGSALTVILIVIAVLAALGLAAWFLMRNRNDDQDPPASGVAATIPGGAPSGPPVDPSMPTGGAADGGWAPPSTADIAPLADPTPVAPTPDATPVAEPAPQPVAEPEPAAEPAPDVIASPTPEQATGAPVWDPVRRQYVQWDPNGDRWLVFDDATQSWGPEA